MSQPILQARPVYTRGELLGALAQVSDDIALIEAVAPRLQASLADLGHTQLGQELAAAAGQLSWTAEHIHDTLLGGSRQ